MLTKSSMYSIRALIFLGNLEPNLYFGAKRLGRELSIPPNYLGKLLQTLAKNGFLISQKGLGGGFCLSKKPEVMCLLDIVEAIEESPFLTGCFLRNSACSDIESCCMHTQWKSEREHIRNMLKTTTIEHLIHRRNIWTTEQVI